LDAARAIIVRRCDTPPLEMAGRSCLTGSVENPSEAVLIDDTRQKTTEK